MSTPKPHSTIATRMSGIREDWLAKTREEILEPDLAIVDPHHHLWDFPTHRYLLPELLADTGSGHKIESTVFIECTRLLPRRRSAGHALAGRDRVRQRHRRHVGQRRLWRRRASPPASSAWST